MAFYSSHIIHVHIGRTSAVGAGKPTILTATEEKEVVVTCLVLQELGYGLTREMVGEVIRKAI